MNIMATLDDFTFTQLRLNRDFDQKLGLLLKDISFVAKAIDCEINKSALLNRLSLTGNVNVQGEEVKYIDQFANIQMINVLSRGTNCAGVCSEEEEEIIIFDNWLNNQSRYVVCFDPLDGSSNLESCVSVGSVFSIYQRVTRIGTPCSTADFLQQGKHQIAAGYMIYGSSTMLVYATRHGVNGFTLDSSIGEFYLSHPDIKCQPTGKILSVNFGIVSQFPKAIQHYLIELQNKRKQFTLRYTGSLVADLHRNLVNGGIFLYPSTSNQVSGKLRLVYECNPFAYIYTIAGGKSTDGKKETLEIVPENIHQRSPIYIGGIDLVDELISKINVSDCS